MTINAEQRRAVAQELRKLTAPGCIRYAEEFYEELREIVARDLDGSFEGVANSLADLINPTCFDTGSKDSKSFTCSACGFSESTLVVSPFTLSFFLVKPSYRYCPKCGAMVVEKEKDDDQ